jgi:hypothetical protein
MNAEQNRMKPSSGESATSRSMIDFVRTSTRTRDTDESWKSANPPNGTCDCSWVTYRSRIERPWRLPGTAPIPSGIPSKVVPNCSSPELMSGTVVPATPGCRATYDGCVVL